MAQEDFDTLIKHIVDWEAEAVAAGVAATDKTVQLGDGLRLALAYSDTTPHWTTRLCHETASTFIEGEVKPQRTTQAARLRRDIYAVTDTFAH